MSRTGQQHSPLSLSWWQISCLSGSHQLPFWTHTYTETHTLAGVSRPISVDRSGHMFACSTACPALSHHLSVFRSYINHVTWILFLPYCSWWNAYTPFSAPNRKTDQASAWMTIGQIHAGPQGQLQWVWLGPLMGHCSNLHTHKHTQIDLT